MIRLILFLSFTFLLSSCFYPSVDFTEEEKSFIRDNVVVVAVENSYYPFIFVENGKLKGMSIDYLDYISRMTGIKFEYKFDCRFAQCLKWVELGQADLLTSVKSTPKRSLILDFTRPYFYTTSSMIYSVKNPETVGIGRCLAVGDFLRNLDPNLSIVEFKDDTDALYSLISGEVESIVVDRETALYFRRQHKFNYAETMIPHDNPISFATRKNHQVLKSILDKSITKVPPNIIREIEAKWK